jgi:acetoin utilization protein AcuB
MTLESIMTRHVVTVRMDDELYTIRDLFNKYRFHHVLVMDKCRVVGVISDRDLLKNTSPFIGKAAERPMDLQSLHRKAHQIMTRALVSGSPATPVGDAALLMLNNRISCLPIINDDGACVGIVTMRDLLRWALKQMADQACAMELHDENVRRRAA